MFPYNVQAFLKSSETLAQHYLQLTDCQWFPILAKDRERGVGVEERKKTAGEIHRQQDPRRTRDARVRGAEKISPPRLGAYACAFYLPSSLSPKL